jgi:hypothetical protein
VCSRALAPRAREIGWSRDLREFCNLKLGDRILKKKWFGPRPEGVPPIRAMLTFEKNKLFFAKVKSLSDKLFRQGPPLSDKECKILPLDSDPAKMSRLLAFLVTILRLVGFLVGQLVRQRFNFCKKQLVFSKT